LPEEQIIGMNEELEVLKTVTARLAGARIPYMMTGSIAVSFYAVPRMTRDIDLVVELSEPDVDRLVRLFQDDFYVDRNTVLRAVTQRAMFKSKAGSFKGGVISKAFKGGVIA